MFESRDLHLLGVAAIFSVNIIISASGYINVPSVQARQPPSDGGTDLHSMSGTLLQQHQGTQETQDTGITIKNGLFNAGTPMMDPTLVIEELVCDDDDDDGDESYILKENMDERKDFTTDKLTRQAERDNRPGHSFPDDWRQTRQFPSPLRTPDRQWQTDRRHSSVMGLMRSGYNSPPPCPIEGRQLADLYNELDHVLMENEWLRYQVTQYDMQHSSQRKPLKKMQKGKKEKRTSAEQKLIVSFTAKTSRDQTFPHGNETIIFDEVINNNGGAYDPHTGQFRCPITGVYLFAATILSDFNSTIETSMTANGQELLRMYSGSNGNRGSGSATAIVSLSEGVCVEIGVFFGNGNYVHRKWSSFSGALLTPH